MGQPTYGVTPTGSNFEWQTLNRIYLFQITAVLAEQGRVHATCIDGLIRREENLELPWGGFSLSRNRSAWMRFMPSVGDLVLVDYGPHSEPRIVSYALAPGAYERIIAARDVGPHTAVVNGEAVNWNPALRSLVHLKEGEWDMRSSGEAYISGDSAGNLTLAGGGRTGLILSKKENDLRASAGLHVFDAEGSYQRLGLVKRKLTPISFKDTTLLAPLMILDPIVNEWAVHIESPPTDPVTGLTLPAPGTSFLVYDEQAGTVRSSAGVPESSSLGLPLRRRSRVYDIGTTTAQTIPTMAYESSVDALGNTQVSLGLAATSAKVVAAPTLAASISCGTMQVDALQIGLGTDPLDLTSQRALLGTDTLKALATFTSTVSAACATAQGLVGAGPHVPSLSALLAGIQTACVNLAATLPSLASTKVTLA